MEPMKYKGFTGSVNWSEEDQMLYGKIEDIAPLVNYEALVPSKLRVAFEEAVDDYLKDREEHMSNFKKYTFELWFRGINPDTAHAIEQISRGKGDLEVMTANAIVVKFAAVRFANAGKGPLGAMTSVVIGAINDVVHVFPNATLSGVKFGTQTEAESILFWETIFANNPTLGKKPCTFETLQEFALSCKEKV